MTHTTREVVSVAAWITGAMQNEAARLSDQAPMHHVQISQPQPHVITLHLPGGKTKTRITIEVIEEGETS